MTQFMMKYKLGTLAARALPILLVAACNRAADETRIDSSSNTAAVVSTTTRDVIQGPAGALHIDDGGTGGVPVLFVHSFGGDSRHWASQLAHLRTTRRAIAMDLRAHGASAVPTNGDYSADAFANDIAAVADSLKLQQFVVIGHSLGGVAGLVYAGAHPDRVAGLMLVGTPGSSAPEVSGPIVAALESEQYQATMDTYMKTLLTNAKPEVAQQVDAEFHKMTRAQSTAITKAIFAYDPTRALGAYNGPILSVSAAAEKESPASLHQLKPAMQHQTMAGTSHWMHMDKPAEFNALMDTFLAGLPAGRP